MTITEMLGQSGILTLLGLCVVFSFIIIMIGAMHLLHAALRALHLDVEPKKESPSRSPSAAPAQDNAAIAAIAAALAQK